MKKTKKSITQKRKLISILFILPTFLLLFLFIVIPILYGFKISFQNYNIAMPASTRVFCGLTNYKNVLANPDFIQSFSWTLEFVFIAVSGTIVLAMLLALALNSPTVKGLAGRLAKTAFILPMMLCPLIVANIWYIIFAPNYGLINSTLNRLQMSAISFFGDTFWARFAVLTVEFWWGTPYVMIILLAALTTVPAELLESAQLEGANKLQTFFHVTLPCIASFVVLVVSIRLMDALRMFDISYALTEGGPSRSTQTIAYFIYETGFKYLKVGEASAAAFLLFSLIIIITFLFLKITNNFLPTDM